MAKKIIGIVLALAMVFSIAVCTVSASAIDFNLPKIGTNFDFGKLGDLFNPANWGNKDKDTTDTTTAPATEDTTKTERQPLIDFYIDYDVVRTLKWGFRLGNVPEDETTTEPTTAEEVTEAPTEPASEQDVEVIDETPEAAAPVEITDATPLADVEQVANTGDAGIAAVVALSAVSAAAFVVAKKK